MKVARLFFLMLCAFITAGVVNGQPQVEKMILQAKQQLAEATSQWDEPGIIEARSLLERLQVQDRHLDLIHYYIALADYRLASRYFLQRSSKAVQYLDDGISHLQKAIQENKKFADAHALLSTLYGQKIGMEPELAMTLGQQSWVEMDMALKLAPENPRIRMLKAMSTYYAPEQFGGSKENGKAQLQEAIALFAKEKISDPLQPDWGHEEALMMLATWHLEDQDTTTAFKLAEEALKVNPKYDWAKMVLDSLKARENK